MHPKIKFKISPVKDVNTFFNFNSEAEYDQGRTLNWAILELYPEFKKYQKGYSLEVSKKVVQEFVKKAYQKREKEIKENLALYQNNWAKVEKDYFNLIEQLFDPKYWPKGKYICYPTIWGVFPRFIEDSTFQIPASKHKTIKYVNVVIAHEMLHFIFYNYFLTKYPKYKKEKYDFFVWRVSEIFNTVVQNSKKWLGVFELESMGYPEHDKIVKELQPKFDKESLTVKELIDEIIKLVERDNLCPIN